MLVKELIEELKKFDENAVVLAADHNTLFCERGHMIDGAELHRLTDNDGNIRKEKFVTIIYDRDDYGQIYDGYKFVMKNLAEYNRRNPNADIDFFLDFLEEMHVICGKVKEEIYQMVNETGGKDCE